MVCRCDYKTIQGVYEFLKNRETNRYDVADDCCPIICFSPQWL